MDHTAEQIRSIIKQINNLWQNGQPDAIRPFLHPDIVMVFPGFSGRSQGADQLIAGFRDFCDNAMLLDFKDIDYQIDVFCNTAVSSFKFDLVYKRDGKTYRSSGRDLWIFENHEKSWKAVWRTMSDLAEVEVNEDQLSGVE